MELWDKWSNNNVLKSVDKYILLIFIGLDYECVFNTESLRLNV